MGAHGVLPGCAGRGKTLFVPSIYQPRRPRASPLWQILTAAWDAFLAGMKTATDTLLESFRARLKLPDGRLAAVAASPLWPPRRCGRLAAVAAVHTFGDYLFFHPHLHVLAADGLFDSEGRFHCMPADSRTRMEYIQLAAKRYKNHKK
jgi:hypothetical protein